MRGIVAIMFVLVLAIAGQAFALDLSEARSKGQVCEKSDGMVKAMGESPSEELKALVASVNEARKAEYARIAGENGQTPDVVGKLSAETIVNDRLEAGQYFEGSDGTCRKK